MKKMNQAGKFWLFMPFLFFVLSSTLYGEGDATSGSLSGATSGAASQAGAVGFIDGSTNTSTVEAVDMQDRAPGVFAAGVTAGGSNPCVVSIGGGLSVPGGGLNFANAYNDGECNVRETLRLMAAISSSEATGNQILLREISCQSVTMWDAFQRTYDATGDDRYFCTNPRPEDESGPIALRSKVGPRTAEVAYDLNNGKKIKHEVVSSMLRAGYEDDAFALLMED